jgi:phenylalanine-4-hydroxylase
VFAGAADSETFFEDLVVEHEKIDVKQELTELENLYGIVRTVRENKKDILEIETDLSDVITTLSLNYPNDWLLRLEIFEILKKKNMLLEQQAMLARELNQLKLQDTEFSELIERGLKLIQ